MSAQNALYTSIIEPRFRSVRCGEFFIIRGIWEDGEQRDRFYCLSYFQKQPARVCFAKAAYVELSGEPCVRLLSLIHI